MRGRFWRVGRRQLASAHSWGPYASPSTWYWSTRVLQWLSQVRVLPFSFAQDDNEGHAVRAPTHAPWRPVAALESIPRHGFMPLLAGTACWGQSQELDPAGMFPTPED